MKKILAFLLAASMALTFFAGCSQNNEDEGGVLSSAPEKVYSLQEAFDTVKEAYGEDYIPSMDLDEAYLSDTMGVTMDNVEEFIAQGPMISAHVDTFVAIKAKEGMGDAVSEELEEYRNNLYDNSFNYPMNMPKIAASEVVTHGDYVFLLMLGKINDDMDATEEDLEKYYEEQTAIGRDALNKYFSDDTSSQ